MRHVCVGVTCRVDASVQVVLLVRLVGTPGICLYNPETLDPDRSHPGPSQSPG